MDRLAKSLEGISNQLQVARDELVHFQSDLGDKADKCQGILNELFEQVYEAIENVESMENARMDTGDSDDEDDDVGVAPSSNEQNQKRNDKPISEGQSNIKFYQRDFIMFPKAQDLKNPGVFHGVQGIDTMNQGRDRRLVKVYTCFCGDDITGYQWMKEHYSKATQEGNLR